MKTLHDNEQMQRMLQSQERLVDRDNEMIRKKQVEMLEKFKRK